MAVIPLGRVIVVALTHILNAVLSIKVTLSGIVMDVSDWQVENAVSPIFSTPYAIVRSFI